MPNRNDNQRKGGQRDRARQQGQQRGQGGARQQGGMADRGRQQGQQGQQPRIPQHKQGRSQQY